MKKLPSVFLAITLMLVTLGNSRADAASVKDFGAVGDATADDTSALQAAINSGAKDIYIPRGRYKITSTLMFGSASAIYKSVIVHGDSGGPDKYDASSVIEWGGAANGTVIQMASVQGSSFHTFHIDGGGNAGVGLLLTSNANGSSNHFNVFDGITVAAVNGTPGIGIHINGNFYATDQDVCCSTFQNIGLYQGYAGGTSAVKIGIKQEGNQTVDNKFRDTTLNRYTSIGMQFIEGDVRLQNVNFIGGTGATDDVYIGNSVLWASIYDSYHEISSGNTTTRHAYNFPDGNRSYSALLSGVRVLWGRSGGNPLYFGQRGELSIIGGSWDGGGTGVLQINNAGYKPASVLGATIASPITLAITGLGFTNSLGNLTVYGLPTSSSELPSGTIWNNSKMLNIVP